MHTCIYSYIHTYILNTYIFKYGKFLVNCWWPLLGIDMWNRIRQTKTVAGLHTLMFLCACLYRGRKGRSMKEDSPRRWKYHVKQLRQTSGSHWALVQMSSLDPFPSLILPRDTLSRAVPLTDRTFPKKCKWFWHTTDLKCFIRNRYLLERQIINYIFSIYFVGFFPSFSFHLNFPGLLRWKTAITADYKRLLEGRCTHFMVPWCFSSLC